MLAPILRTEVIGNDPSPYTTRQCVVDWEPLDQVALRVPQLFAPGRTAPYSAQGGATSGKYVIVKEQWYLSAVCVTRRASVSPGFHSVHVFGPL
jgi:hypothetical protein